MSSFRWKRGWPCSSESIMEFNLLIVRYDSPRLSMTLNYDFSHVKMVRKTEHTSGIANSFDTAAEVTPDDFAHLATSQSRRD